MTPSDNELRRELAHALGRPIARLERRPYACQTSFPLEELEVWMDGGEPLRMIFKDVGPHRLAGGARAAKPRFLYDPLREVHTYSTILGPAGIGAPVCYGTVANRADGRFWLFLEKVAGVELWQVGALDAWQEAARWLAEMHERCGEARSHHLLRYDRALYLLWLRRARAFSRRPELDRIALGYDRVVDLLLSLPTGFIHGECYASNLLVQETGEALRIRPIDWEMAAVGPNLIDLAALTTGGWSERERAAIVSAYGAGMADGELEEALAACRLQLALQWLGWSRDWSPPPEHAQDWLREALRAAERLGL
jgi:Phosphotransferase enzyme family